MVENVKLLDDHLSMGCEKLTEEMAKTISVVLFLDSQLLGLDSKLSGRSKLNKLDAESVPKFLHAAPGLYKNFAYPRALCS